MKQRCPRHTIQIARIREGAIAVVQVNCVPLVGKIGDDQVRQPVVVVIRKIDAHTRIGAPLSIHGNPRGQAHFLKCSVAFVVVEKLLHRIVGDENIRVAIAVVVSDGNTQPFARLVESYLRGYLGKAPVTLIVINERNNWLKEVRMAIRAVPVPVFTAV